MIQNTYKIVDSKTGFDMAQFSIASKTWNGPKVVTIMETAWQMVSKSGSYRILRHNGSDWQPAGIVFSK